VIIVHNDLIASPVLKRICPEARVIVWLHNEQRTNNRAMAKTIEATDAFVAVSKCTLDWNARQHSFPPGKAHFIHNAVNTGTFTPRADLNPGAGGVKVLFLGRIDPNKGPDLVADAVGVLKSKGIPVQLSVAGALWWYDNGRQMADPYMQKLKAKLDAVGANYLGLVTRPDVPELIRSHDIACVLSRTNDPCPLVGMEAMASGCAVLSTNRGGLPEVCDDAAIVVDPDDFDAVVSGLTRLATEPAALLDYKRRGLEKAKTNTWANRMDEFEALLRQRLTPTRRTVSADPEGAPWAMPS
jgi:glycosyltransferase involved in cell wall biosynthesis